MAVKAVAESKWPAWKVEKIPLKKLRPYAQNAKDHSDEQVELLAKSMREFGWVMSILRDEKGEIIAGHGRVLAGLRNKWVHAPVITAKGWTAAHKRAYRLMDNRLSELATWNIPNRKKEVESLVGEFDLSMLGWSDAEVKSMLAADELEIPDLDENDDFEGSVETEHKCPKCGYTWTGKSEPEE